MEFLFNGHEIAFEAGQSVTAALVRAGERDSGVFCGIGVCFGCLVIIGDKPVRGCVTQAEPGQVISRAL